MGHHCLQICVCLKRKIMETLKITELKSLDINEIEQENLVVLELETGKKLKTVEMSPPEPINNSNQG